MAAASLQLEDTTRARTELQNENTTLATDLRLASQREAKLRLQLEKLEKQSSGAAALKAKASKLATLEARLEELQRVHEESKEKRARENADLQREVERGKERSRAAAQQADEWKAQAAKWQSEAESQLQSAGKVQERLRTELEEAQQRIRALQEEGEAQRAGEALLREKLHKSEREATELVRALQKERLANRTASDGQVEALRTELAAERSRLQQLQAEVERYSAELQEAQRDHEQDEAAWQCNLALVAKAGGLAVEAARQQGEERVDQLRVRLLIAQREAIGLDALAQERWVQIQELVALVKQVQEDREQANMMARIADLDLALMLDQRHLDRSINAQQAPACEIDVALPQLDKTDETEGLAATLNDSDTHVELLSEQARTARLTEEIGELHARHLELAAEHRSTISALSQLRTQHERITVELASREAQLDLFTAQLGDAEQAKVRLQEAVREQQEAKKELKAQIEANRAMAAKLSNARLAEAAWKEERTSLASHIADLSHYQELYTTLSLQTRHLVERNALAESELASLSALNTSLLSHSNPHQKILYMDRIRRELDETKQAHLAVKLELEGMEDRCLELEEELRRYKAVETPLYERPKVEMVRVRRAEVEASVAGTDERWRTSVAGMVREADWVRQQQQQGEGTECSLPGSAPTCASAASLSRSTGPFPPRTASRKSLVGSGALRVRAPLRASSSSQPDCAAESHQPRSSALPSAAPAAPLTAPRTSIPIASSKLGIKAKRVSDMHTHITAALPPPGDTSVSSSSSAASPHWETAPRGLAAPIESTPHHASTLTSAAARRRKMRPSLVVGAARRVSSASAAIGTRGRSSLTIIPSGDSEASVSFDPDEVARMGRGGGWIDDETLGRAEGRMTIDEPGR